MLFMFFCPSPGFFGCYAHRLVFLVAMLVMQAIA